MDKEGCPWLDNGKGCNNETMQGGSKYLVMPIPVDPLYPAGNDSLIRNCVHFLTFFQDISTSSTHFMKDFHLGRRKRWPASDSTSK